MSGSISVVKFSYFCIDYNMSKQSVFAHVWPEGGKIFVILFFCIPFLRAYSKVQLNLKIEYTNRNSCFFIFILLCYYKDPEMYMSGQKSCLLMPVDWTHIFLSGSLSFPYSLLQFVPNLIVVIHNMEDIFFDNIWIFILNGIKILCINWFNFLIAQSIFYYLALMILL